MGILIGLISQGRNGKTPINIHINDFNTCSQYVEMLSPYLRQLFLCKVNQQIQIQTYYVYLPQAKHATVRRTNIHTNIRTCMLTTTNWRPNCCRTRHTRIHIYTSAGKRQ